MISQIKGQTDCDGHLVFAASRHIARTGVSVIEPFSLLNHDMRKSVLSFAMLVSAATLAIAGETPAPVDAKVYFIDLKDGDTVTSPVTIRFGLSGMGVAPAGTEAPNTGHHHLIIDDKIEGKRSTRRSRWMRSTCISARARPKLW